MSDFKLTGKWFVRVEATGFITVYMRYELGQIEGRVDEVEHGDQFIVRVEPMDGSPFPYPIHRVESIMTIERGYALFSTRTEAERHFKACVERSTKAEKPPSEEMN